MCSQLSLVLIWLCVSAVFQYCGGYHQPIEEKVFYSDVFAYGRVGETSRNDSGSDRTYTVEVDVYCVFKGGPLPQVINITVPEYSSDFCLYSSFLEGRKYLLFLDTVGVELRPAFSSQKLREHEEVDYVSFLCDVDIQYPIGVTEEEATEMCPEPYPDFTDCARYTPNLEPEGDEVDPTQTTSSIMTSRTTPREDETTRTVVKDVLKTSPVNSVEITATESTKQLCSSGARLCFTENLIAVYLTLFIVYFKSTDLLYMPYGFHSEYCK